MAQIINRLDVLLAQMSPTLGTEIQKTRPVVVVSPPYVNSGSKIIIVPMTSKRKNFKTRIPTVFKEIEGDVALEHIRSIDKMRVLKKLGKLDVQTGQAVLHALQDLFHP